MLLLLGEREEGRESAGLGWGGRNERIGKEATNENVVGFAAKEGKSK